jgi:microcystin-dependent protein
MTITGSSILQRDPGATVVVAPYGPRGPVVSGTSLSSITIGLGEVTFTMVEYGLGFAPGIRLRATAVGAADQWMEGVAVTYTDDQLTIDVDLVSGSGNYDPWNINVAGERGAQGPIGSTGATGQVPEAPQDSKNYLRFNATWQSLDPDLAAIAALTGVNTIYYRSNANIWSPITIGSGISFAGGVLAAAAGGGNVSNSGTPVNGQLAQWINNQQIQGYTVVTQAPGTNDASIATTAFVQNAVAGAPIGMVVPFAGATAPPKWQLCYGQNVSRTTFAALFAAIGTVHGAGDGSATFTLPDLRGRAVAGKDNMGGTSASRLGSGLGGPDGNTLGAVGGLYAHHLILAEMPPHNHMLGYSPSSLGAGGGADFFTSEYTGYFRGGTDYKGGDGSHNNMQPTMVLNYIIYAGA